MGRAPDIYDGTKTHNPNPDRVSLARSLPRSGIFCFFFWQSKVNGTAVVVEAASWPCTRFKLKCLA